MIVTIASALLFVEIKDAAVLKMLSKVMQSLWLKWELRAMVVLSLTVQLILIICGNRRKFSGKKLKIISFLVWTMYLFADWLATVALSTLLKSRKEQIGSPLVIFWTPFLLLHLGGPDTITAYSLSDNELWNRHFLGLIFQIGVAIYVYVKFWTLTVTTLTFMAIPIFIVGIIKYAERVWAQFKASSSRFRKSVFSDATSFLPELFNEHSKEDITLEKYLDQQQIKGQYRYLHQAFHLYQVFRPLFSNLKLRIYKKFSYVFELGPKVTAEQAFKMVEIELGFLYDTLYTKIPIVLSRWGVILRCICLSFTVSTLIAFLIIVGKHGYSKVDIGISYLLMVGAIFLEIYSAILHLSSDRGIYWLISQNNSFLKAIASKLALLTKSKKGVRYMAQHSLLEYCLKPRKIKLAPVLTILDPEDKLEKHFHTSWMDMSPELKEIIYTHLLEKRKKYQEAEFEFEYLSKLLDERGFNVLKDVGNRDFGWSVSETEVTHSLLIWHIVTDLVFHDDHQRFRVGGLGPYCQISKLLSNYMMYLLFHCPAMLPEGIGNKRHHDTCIEAENFFSKKLKFKDAIDGLLELSDIETRSFFIDMGSLRKSVLFEGYKIAFQLRELVSDFRWDHQEKWELIAKLWLDMLTYVASRCSWKEHAVQLQHSDELLTHVALLMAHLGLSKEINMVDLPSRLKDVEFEPSWYWNKLDRLAYYLA